MRNLFALVALLFSFVAFGQPPTAGQLKYETKIPGSGTGFLLRGLTIPNDNLITANGSGGLTTIARSYFALASHAHPISGVLGLQDSLIAIHVKIESMGGGGTWGSITGTLSDQTDLQAELDAKADDPHTHVSADVTDASTGGNGVLDAGLLMEYGSTGEAKFSASSGMVAVEATADDNYALVATSSNAIGARIRTLDALDVADILRLENQYGNGVIFNNAGEIDFLGGGEVGTRANLGLSTKAEFDAANTDGDFLYVGDISQYTDEMAQDAVGAMVDATIVYVDGTPLLTRAALTGDVTAPQASNATTIANDAVTNAKAANMAQSTIKGRAALAGTGDPTDLTPDQTSTILDGASDPFTRLTFTTSTYARANATYITRTSSGSLTDEQAMGDLTSGIVYNTTTTGVQSIAVEGTHYYAPGGTDVAVADGGTGASDAAGARTNLGLVIGVDVQPPPQVAVLTSDFTTTSATPVDVTGYTLTLTDPGTYNVLVNGFYASPNSATGAALTLTITGSPSIRSFRRELFTTATAAIADMINQDDAGTVPTTVGGINVNRSAIMTGVVKTNGANCVIQVRAVRGGSSNTITVPTGCNMVAQRIQ